MDYRLDKMGWLPCIFLPISRPPPLIAFPAVLFLVLALLFLLQTDTTALLFISSLLILGKRKKSTARLPHDVSLALILIKSGKRPRDPTA